jgi:hypothetical protein
MGYFDFTSFPEKDWAKTKILSEVKDWATRQSRLAFTFMGYFELWGRQKGITPKRNLSEVKDLATGTIGSGLHFHGIFSSRRDARKVFSKTKPFRK